MNDMIVDDEFIADASWVEARTTTDLIRELLETDGESARHYLRESWLAGVFGLLRSSRRAAGLTQQELADKLGVKQSAIARLERAGDTKLSTVWNYLAACGQAPAEIETVLLSQLRAYALADPAAPRTAPEVGTWKLRWVFDAPASRRTGESIVSIEIEPRHEGVASERRTASDPQTKSLSVAA